MFSDTYKKKRRSSVFTEQIKRPKGERRGEERRRRSNLRHTDNKTNAGLDSASSPTKKEKTNKKQNKERLVGRTEPRVKGERKGLFCAFRTSGAQIHTNAHAYSRINTSLHTRTLASA